MISAHIEYALLLCCLQLTTCGRI